MHLSLMLFVKFVLTFMSDYVATLFKISSGAEVEFGRH